MTASGSLPLTVQHQLQKFWCWAACTSSTSAFFDTASSWTQCRLANAELSQSGCCENGASGACNKPWYLDAALRRTDNLAGRREGRASWAEICEEVDEGRPVCARVGWQGGGGHFVIIVGYSDGAGARVLNVEDPWTGSAAVAYDEFAERYQRSGVWTHTYLTRS